MGHHCQPEHQLYSQPGMRNASLEALTMIRPSKPPTGENRIAFDCPGSALPPG
jgi:hypothetical protein